MSANSSSGFAAVNGINMYYEIHGAGKPLVLIHGGGSTIETNFSKILPLFAKHYKVIAVELQAHGHTGDRDAPETFQQDADDVAALLKQLGIDKAYVLGFSNGGSTTMQIAIRHQNVVEKIVVVAGAYKRNGFIAGFFDWMTNANLTNMPQPLQDGYLKINPNKDALQNMHDKDADRMRNFEDWNNEDIKRITCPALIINGDKDVITVEHALEISRTIPDAQLIILPGVHGECVGEICTLNSNSSQYEITASLIKDFLDK